MKNRLVTIVLFLVLSVSIQGQRQMEYLTRGLVVLKAGTESAFVSWRLLATDAEDVAFNVYRNSEGCKAVKLNKEVMVNATSYLDVGLSPSELYTYSVVPVIGGRERTADGQYVFSMSMNSWPYLTIPLKTPENYSPGDCSAADLDGDGNYELIVHMAGRGRDNSQAGNTDAPIFHAYKLDGTLLWTINLGTNIREGAHYTQFLAYDFNGDGRAEVVMKTADGTVDGLGKVIGDAAADHLNKAGHVVKGPEYLTVFDGMTGAALTTINYLPARHPFIDNPSPEDMKKVWGDDHYNRSERYLACVAYLNGQTPSIVMCRGYYARVAISAFNWKDGRFTNIWNFDSNDKTANNVAYYGQGNHNLSVGDVDGDGCDEIIYGSAVIDNNGKGLYSTGLGHADAMHFSDLDPQRPGLEVFNIQERFGDAGMNFRDAKTGEILWRVPSLKAAVSGGDKGEGPGRGACFNIDPRFSGNESWAFGAGISGLWECKGLKVSDVTPQSCNFAVWWDGDLLRELLDRNTVYKWDWTKNDLLPILDAKDCSSNNGTKSTPSLSADLFGDWREEVVFRASDNQSLRIYSSIIPTTFRFVTLMHDPVYRLGVAWQNVAYNQPPHTSFYIGDEMAPPPLNRFNIPKWQPK